MQIRSVILSQFILIRTNKRQEQDKQKHHHHECKPIFAKPVSRTQLKESTGTQIQSTMGQHSIGEPQLKLINKSGTI